MSIIIIMVAGRYAVNAPLLPVNYIFFLALWQAYPLVVMLQSLLIEIVCITSIKKEFLGHWHGIAYHQHDGVESLGYREC